MSQMFEFAGRPEIIVFGLGLALFLTLYWVVRGAPVGQAAALEPKDAPPARYRDRVVCLAILGFLMILGGAFAAIRYGILWSLLPFITGFALVIRVQQVNRKYRHVSPTLRRTLKFSETALTCTLVGGILFVGNVFAFKYGGKPIDFTHDAAFSLSTLSVNTTEALERPLKFTLMLGRDEGTARQRDRVRQLVDLYKAVNPDKVEIAELVAFNPSHAAELDALLKRNPDLAVSRGDTVVLEYGEGDSVDRAVVPVADFFRRANSASGSGDSQISTAFSGEDAITSTLVRFREGKRKLVAFTSGHGEPSIDALDAREMGLGLWRSRLASLGTDAVELNLLKDDVSARISLLVIAAPRTGFQAQEIARIKAFLSSGGPLLLVMNGQVKTGLEEILALHNIAFEPGIIHDGTWNLSRRADQVVTPPLPNNDHPISQALVGEEFLIPQASPLKIVGASQSRTNESRPNVNPAIINSPLARTSPTAWSETNPDRPTFDQGVDPTGPFLVGIAAMERSEVAGAKPRPKLVVLSSPFLGLNPILTTASTNLDLLQNSMQWLRGKEETLGVAPKIHNAIRFTADPNLRAKLHLVPTVISVVLIMGFGLMMYLARRV